MEDITQLLHSNFINNMEYLKEYHNSLFLEIEELSNSFMNKTKKEQYSIEIINGYFDIHNNENNSYFYALNSYEHAENIAKHINFSKDGSLDLLRKDINTKKLVFNDYYYEMKPIINFINNNVDFNNIEFKKIYKFIYIGTGLGFHIQEINKKIDSYTTLIIEPDIEIFRLSLFTMDYRVFDEGNKKLFLNVGNDKLKRLNTLAKFSDYHDYMNYNIKYYNFLESTAFIKKEIIDFFGNNSVIDFPYKAIISILGRTFHYMKEKNKFLSLPKALKTEVLENKKILLISAGPSLDNYIDWIKEYQNKFIIVCVDVITRKLEKNGIIPDIVVSIDPSEKCADFLNTENPDFLNNSAIIFLSQHSPEAHNLMKDKNIFLSQALRVCNRIGYLGSSPNVGTFSFVASILLKAKELYLIGCDAAFNQETGERYAKDSSHTLKYQDNLSIDNVYDRDDIVVVKGNLKEKVKTNNVLLSFRGDYEKAVFILKKDFNFQCYNLSDGAYIEGITPIKKEDMNLIANSLESKSTNIIERFNNISEIITKEDMDYESSIKNITLIINKMKKFRKLEFISSNNFLDKKIEITTFILESLKDEKDYVFADIFLKFIALSDIYINFVLNLRQKELNDKKHLKDLGKYWTEAVIDVFNDILTILKAD